MLGMNKKMVTGLALGLAVGFFVLPRVVRRFG